MFPMVYEVFFCLLQWILFFSWIPIVYFQIFFLDCSVESYLEFLVHLISSFLSERGLHLCAVPLKLFQLPIFHLYYYFLQIRFATFFNFDRVILLRVIYFPESCWMINQTNSYSEAPWQDTPCWFHLGVLDYFLVSCLALLVGRFLRYVNSSSWLIFGSTKCTSLELHTDLEPQTDLRLGHRIHFLL